MKLVDLSQLSVILPVLCGSLMLKRLSDPFRILFVFFLFSCGVEIGADYMKSAYKNNMPLLHVFNVIELCTYTIVFIKIFKGNPVFKRTGMLILFVVPVLFILEAFLLERLWEYPSITRTTGTLLIELFTLLQFYILFKETNDPELFRRPPFWLLFGVLAYFFSSMFFFLIAGPAAKYDKETFEFAHQFHAIINIICNFIFAYSFLCFRFKSA